VACQVGVKQGHDADKSLDIMSFGNPAHHFLNVDTTTPEGLHRAHDLGFAQAEVAELVFTSFLPLASNTIVDIDHKGSIFTTFRHPIDRAVSLFYYLQDADWEPTYRPEWKNWTLLEYVESGKVERNYMVRAITGKYRDPIVASADLQIAMTFVTDHVWVGMLERMDESLRRFGALYGWDQQGEDWEHCVDHAVNVKANGHEHPQIDKSSLEYEKLEELLSLDIALYKHAAALFDEQGLSYFQFDEDE